MDAKINKKQANTLAALTALGGKSNTFRLFEEMERQAKGRFGLSIGSFYVGLYDMEEKGFVISEWGEPVPERGGKRRRYYEITEAGTNALTEFSQTRHVSFFQRLKNRLFHVNPNHQSRTGIVSGL